jgi:hypothetical protein
MLARARELTAKSAGAYVVPELDSSGDLLVTGRELMSRIHCLAAAYAITGEEQFFTRVHLETMTVSSAALFPQWGLPGRALDMAEFAHAVSIAYDWFHPKWTRDQRYVIREALVRNSIAKARDFHNNQAWWTVPVKASNWNLVANGGFLMAALSVGSDGTDAQDALTTEVATKSIESLQRGMAWFDEKGANVEGTGYWIYGMEYLTLAIDTLLAATGADHGLLATKGLSQTVNYVLGMSSNTGFAFGHGDSANSVGGVHVMQWVGKRFGDEAALYAGKNAPTGNRYSGLFYYTLNYTGQGNAAAEQALPTFNSFPGPVIVSMRENWTDTNAMFLAFKGGDNQFNHTHLDLGSFVFAADGFPWFTELGGDSYSLPGYFSARESESSPAYDYYRIRPEGQNTLVMNPNSAAGQNITARATVQNMNPSMRHGVVNLSNAYSRWMGRTFRGFGLLSETRGAFVRDHLDLAKQSTQIYWTAHTTAKEARFLDSSRRSVVLYETGALGRRLLVFVRENNQQFQATPDGSPLLLAEPLPGSPREFWNVPIGNSGVKQNLNEGFRKLVLKGSTSSFQTTTVVFVPLKVGDPEVVPTIADARLAEEPAQWPAP